MFIPAATQTHTKTKAMRERSHARANTIALTHGIFPIQPDRRTSPSTLPPLLFLYVASSGAAGTIELTHALFPLPALCFPYGNPLCVPGAGSGSEGSPTEQNNTTKTALGYSKELRLTDRNIKLEPRSLVFSLNSLWFPADSLAFTQHRGTDANAGRTTEACDAVCQNVCCLGNGSIHSQRDQCEEGQVLAVVVPLGHIRDDYYTVNVFFFSAQSQCRQWQEDTLTVGGFCCFFNELNGHLTPRPILAMQ